MSHKWTKEARKTRPISLSAPSPPFSVINRQLLNPPFHHNTNPNQFPSINHLDIHPSSPLTPNINTILRKNLRRGREPLDVLAGVQQAAFHDEQTAHGLGPDHDDGRTGGAEAVHDVAARDALARPGADGAGLGVVRRVHDEVRAAVGAGAFAAGQAVAEDLGDGE